MKSKLILASLAIAFAFITSNTFAGSHDGNGNGTGQGSGNVPVPADQNNDHGTVNNGGNYNNGVKGKSAEAPFDGGLSLLAGAGIVYGLKRARDRRKKTNAIA